ncbi:MAG: efflux RND transporter permease subunit, partial [Hyphomicrobiales bacterium]|nr:efflux RND transporter permease subunit [Hyphomicrobiales bacterium]
TLQVPTASGATVPLSAVADVSYSNGPSLIRRYDRARKIAVEASFNGTDALGEVTNAIRALPAVKEMPKGVTLKDSGDAEVMGQVFSSFAQAMGAGLLMVLAVLVLLLASVVHPITILLSLPLSIGGVVSALLLTHNAFSMPVVIGMLMLTGIVTKNAIMLVDFAIEGRKRGLSRAEALVDAGHKRARPIVMTTLAMAAGMMPAAFALGEGGEFRAPMAIAVIGGLLMSTLLSLVFVPAFYVAMDKAGWFLGWLFGRFVGPGEEAETDADAETAEPTFQIPAPAAARPQAAE